MRNSTKRFVEDLLMDYPKIPGYIKYKKEQIKYPYQMPDNNVGGGQAHGLNNSPAERIVLRIDDSEFINAFKNQARAIENAMDNCEDAFINVIHDYYFDKTCHRTLQGLGMEHGYSSTKVYKERDRFFKHVLDNLGLSYIYERDQILKDERRKKLHKDHK